MANAATVNKGVDSITVTADDDYVTVHVTECLDIDDFASAFIMLTHEEWEQIVQHVSRTNPTARKEQ